MGHTTASLVQAELRATTAFGGTTNPSLATVNTWIDEETDNINQLSGTNWGSISCTDTIDFNLDNGYEITLKNSPIISVTSVKYRTSADGETAVWVTKTADQDYLVYPEEGRIHIVSSYWKPVERSRNIEIKYTAGYSTTPAFVQKHATKAVALRVLNSLISQNVNDRNDGGSINVGSISIVEPGSYGVNSYKTLQDEVAKGASALSSSDFKVYRYGY